MDEFTKKRIELEAERVVELINNLECRVLVTADYERWLEFIIGVRDFLKSHPEYTTQDEIIDWDKRIEEQKQLIRNIRHK
ncbi:hypothetical protein MYX82_04495 [Acidobacteria bacterium AH-259-D05]|nr:hypothetical protein [Acidobacteria bacterium AH-259-D05]